MNEESWRIIIRVARAIGARIITVPPDDPAMRQTCKICGRPDKFDFNVPDKIWRAVVPVQFRKLVVCLYCFDELARQRDIAYAGSIQSLYFAGDKASFEFRTVAASELKTKNSSGYAPSICTHCRARRSSAWYIVRHNSK